MSAMRWKRYDIIATDLVGGVGNALLDLVGGALGRVRSDLLSSLAGN